MGCFRMAVSVEEMKNYLRIDFEDDDVLIENLIMAGKKQCMDILRTDDEEDLYACANGKIAVMFTGAGRRDSDGCGGFEVESDVPEE